MNKILLDSTIKYEKSGIYKLELVKDTEIDINNSNITLYIIANKDIYLNINIKGNVEIYNFTTNNLKTTINLYAKSRITLYQMAITKNKIVNDITIRHLFKKTVSNIKCNGISYENGSLEFIINGISAKGCNNSVCNEISRIITLDEACGKIKPNLYIDEFDCTFNHSSYIGPFSDKLLFYLETKGINKMECYNMLLSSFIKSKTLPKEYENIIDLELNKVIRR